jgi:hypothetical protein
MSEETPAKIEPTLKPIEDAPPIAVAAPAETRIEPALAVKAPEKIDEPAKAEARIAPPKVDAGSAPAKEPPVMPRAAQIEIEPAAAGKAPGWLRATRVRDGKDAKPAQAPAVSTPRSASRFPLLAATVAIAACFGAIAGAFGGSMFGHAPTAPQIAAHGAATTSDEIRALKETVAQLRTATRTLNDNVSALKLSVSNANAQLTKMSEALERRAAAPASETTGSIQKPAAAPVVLGAPPAPLQHPVVPGWTLRRVYDGAALIEGREGIIEVEPGTTIPGLGRIDDIKKQDGRWAVFTSKGIIVAAGK